MTSVYAHQVPLDYRYPSVGRKQLLSSMQNFSDIIKVRTQDEYNKRPQHQRSFSLQNKDIQGSFYIKPREKFNRLSYINKVDDIDIGKKSITEQQNYDTDIFKNAKFVYKKIPGQINNPINPNVPILTKIHKKLEQNEPYIQNSMIGGIKKSDYDQIMRRTQFPFTGVDVKKNQYKKYQDKYDNLNVKDINLTDKKEKQFRNTNPLLPEYYLTVNRLKGKEKYGKIEKSSPSTNYRNVNRETDLSLKTNDIQGCKANYCQIEPLMLNTRTQFTNTNNIKDIKGTDPGSAFTIFQTGFRQTNPLKPDYQLLGVKNPKSHLFNGLSKVLDTKPKYHTNLIKKNESDIDFLNRYQPSVTEKSIYKTKLDLSKREIHSQNSNQSNRVYRSQSSNYSQKKQQSVASQLNFLLKKNDN